MLQGSSPSSPCGVVGPSRTANMATSSISPVSPFPAPQADGAVNLVYRDQLFPRRAFALAFEALLAGLSEEPMSHDGRPSRARSRARLRGGASPRVAGCSRRRVLPAISPALIERFRPKDAALPVVVVQAALPRHLRSDRDKRWRSSMKATDKIDAARIDLLLSELRLPGIKLIWARPGDDSRQRRLGRTGPLPGGPRRTGDGGAKPPSLRTASGGSPIAAGKDPRHVRLHRCANDLEGAGASARGRRRLARKGSQSFVLRAARRREIPSRGGARFGLDRKGLARLFTRTTDLVQKLQIARRDLTSDRSAIAKLDKYTRGLERADGGHAHQAAPHPYSDPGDRLRPRRHGQRGRVADRLDRRPAQRDPRAGVKTGRGPTGPAPSAVEAVRKLASRWCDRDIAVSLNRMRWKTGDGETWTTVRVRDDRPSAARGRRQRCSITR